MVLSSFSFTRFAYSVRAAVWDILVAIYIRAPFFYEFQLAYMHIKRYVCVLYIE